MTRKPQDGSKRRKLDGPRKAGEAQWVKLACSTPPEEHARWSMQLLTDELVALEVFDSISDDSVRRTLQQNEIKPWRHKMGPPEAHPAGAGCGVCCGHGAGLTSLCAALRPMPPRRLQRPVGRDERPTQLIGQTREAITTSKGEHLTDYEYVRHGVGTVWMFNEPLGGQCDVRAGQRASKGGGPRRTGRTGSGHG